MYIYIGEIKKNLPNATVCAHRENMILWLYLQISSEYCQDKLHHDVSEGK